MKPTVTQKMLAEMLTENTGRHFLDSGGAYGRHWERNQGRTVEDFINEPFAVIDDFSYTRSVFHYLDERLEYIPALDRKLQRFMERKSEQDNSWHTSAYNWLEEYLPSRGYEITGLYGDGEPVSYNTYNGEDTLSQVIQFVLFNISGEDDYLPSGEYVILEIHGGCDVRGGYTKPRLFAVSQGGEYMFDEHSAYLNCPGNLPENQINLYGSVGGNNHTFDSEDAGYSWVVDGVWGSQKREYSLDDFFPEDEEEEKKDYPLCPIHHVKMEAVAY